MANYYEFLLGQLNIYKKDDKYEEKHAGYIDNLIKYFIEPIMDIGCGTGKALDKLKEYGKNDIYGLDITGQSIEKVREKGHRAQIIDIQFSIPYLQMYKIHTVYLSHVLEHIYDIEDFLKNIKQVVKRIIIVVPRESIDDFNDNPTHSAVFPHKKNLKRYFKDWDIIDCRQDNNDIYLIADKKNEYSNNNSNY